jgi:hypothetical protein
MKSMTDESIDLLRECDDLIERLDVLLGAIEPMTAAETSHLPRLGRRREGLVSSLADLSEDLGLDGVGGRSVEVMRSSFEEVTSTRVVLEKLDRVRARLDTKRLRAEANMAERVYLFYELARRMARGNEAVRERLEPVAAAFRRLRSQHAGTTPRADPDTPRPPPRRSQTPPV